MSNGLGGDSVTDRWDKLMYGKIMLLSHYVQACVCVGVGDGVGSCSKFG